MSGLEIWWKQKLSTILGYSQLQKYLFIYEHIMDTEFSEEWIEIVLSLEKQNKVRLLIINYSYKDWYTENAIS